MCQAAWAASHTKNSFLSAFYRRMSVRKGASRAVMALAHHMIVVVHQVLSRKEEYVEFGGDYYDRRNKPKTVARLVMRLSNLGYRVDLTQLPADPELQPIEPVDAPKPKRRGRPCKCKERGIVCKHHTAAEVNSLIQQVPSAGKFS